MKLSRIPLVLLIVALFQGAFGQEEDSPPWPLLKPSANTEPLANTAPLKMEGDISSQMVAGIDKFLLRQIDESVEKREQYWKRDLSSPEAYAKSVAGNRQRLREMLGMVDAPLTGPLRLDEVAPVASTDSLGFRPLKVRWPVLDSIDGAGVLLMPPADVPVVADVILLWDADDGEKMTMQVGPLNHSAATASSLARAGCRVLLPILINRNENQYKMPNREWLHRPAYELGRTLAGYEVQKVLCAVDALTAHDSNRPLGVIGWGEGGRLALYAGALDTRIGCTAVAGYFNSRQRVWDEPADRTVFGLLQEFGDAEIASLVAPRPLLIQSGSEPTYVFRPDKNGVPQVLESRATKNGKPGILIAPNDFDEGKAEFDRLTRMLGKVWPPNMPQHYRAADENPFSNECIIGFAATLGLETPDSLARLPVEYVNHFHSDYSVRHAEQLAEIEHYNQRILQEAYQERIEYFKDLKTDNLEAFNASIEAYRDKFRRDVVGEFDVEKLPLNPRSRPFQEGPKTISYEVVLDVFPDVFAYGVLTLPKDLKLDGSEKRPVVVCQHGLEGRPQDVVGEPKFKAYKAFATRLAERGFITFAPQNPYIFFDRFRTLQFKSAAIGCTLFSIIVPQHQQITDWLQTQAYVDGERIGFYGLSYGGKSAMRIPPLVSDYALSICSADFNEWVWKNAATDQRSLRYSYANKGEYEIFEFGLGRTFNYAEMAFLICPRPFMVERGHFDGVGPDDRVAQEFAKIRFLYQARLGIGDRTEIEWFPGPHTINGVGTYDFLHRHLDWPVPE